MRFNEFTDFGVGTGYGSLLAKTCTNHDSVRRRMMSKRHPKGRALVKSAAASEVEYPFVQAKWVLRCTPQSSQSWTSLG